MSVDNFIPEVWSARLLINLRKKYVFRSLTNEDYEGEIKEAGDTVKIITPGAITVSNYAGSVSYENLPSTLQALLIDQQKYWGFKVPDIDKVQANANLMDTFMNEATNAMADAIDQNIASLYTAAGNTVNLDISSDYTGVRQALLDASEDLDDAGVPEEGRWLVVSPLVYKAIKGASDYSPASELGDEVKMSGAVGKLEGFNIFKSRNVQISTQHKCLAGYNGAITVAEQIAQTEAMRDPDSFADLVRGLVVFGRKVVRPGALVLINTTVA